MNAGGRLLRFVGASVGYSGNAVLRDVDLDVRAGELVGLVGPNGAGKSTLLRAVTGAAQQLGGEIELLDRPVRSLGDAERARDVGVVPQAQQALFSFSAFEYVAMGRHPRLSRFAALSEDDTAACMKVMALTDTDRLAEAPVDTLSGGDLQRLTLAQALAQEPRVLLLDEPTSHLDLNHRLQVLDLVRSLADGGMAVLGVFHDLDLAARYADRLAVVDDGGVDPVGSPAEVLTSELVARVFRVRAVVGLDPVSGAPTVVPVLRDEAAAPTREERVLLVCGSGSGARLMRVLALAGLRVHVGALNRGDIDFSVAEALDLGRVELPPFGEMGPGEEEAVAAEALAADIVVVCGTPFGRANLRNLRAVAPVAERVLFLGEVDESRDFSGGEVVALARDLVARGARVLQDEHSAPDVILEFVSAGKGGA